MIADSLNTALRFVEYAPDWSQPYVFSSIWNTSITKAKNGAEQRGSGRQRPRYGLSYSLRGLNTAEFSVRRSFIMKLLTASFACPIWHAYETLSGIAGDVATLTPSASLLHRTFKIGSYAYFVQTGKTSCFRKITAISANTITLQTGNAASPDIVAPAYTAGARVYPCLVGVLMDNGTEFVPNRLDQTDVILSVIEL